MPVQSGVVNALPRYLSIFLLIGTGIWTACFRLSGLDAFHTYLLSVNTVVFVMYACDKTAARRDWVRVPENLLHLGALSGGSPAAFLGQRLLRHKTAKRSFQLRYWTIVFLQSMLGAVLIMGLSGR